MSNTLVVFTYAPAGLGHIRVTDALIEGLPLDNGFVVFAPHDTHLESIHRFTSVNTRARRIMEWVQHGVPQTIFTRWYRKYLKSHAEYLYVSFISLIKSREYHSDNLIVVSTHFGLAYQLGELKSRLEKELNTKIRLVVQVTDDSPQYIWYVDTADLLVVPSEKTRAELQKYAEKEKLAHVDIEIIPYPISASFGKILPDEKLAVRMDQYDPEKNSAINIVIPVSGAAVGMNFFVKLMDKLHRKSKRFVFHVVCKNAPFTKNFIREIKTRDFVRLSVSDTYPGTVEAYCRIYSENVISAEVTKPSEQCFKALLSSKAVGGAFLFLAEPVGRQEFDNVSFLTRHELISPRYPHIRGLQLPFGSSAAADFIWEQFKNGDLMEKFKKYDQVKLDEEVCDNGVGIFWAKVLGEFKYKQETSIDHVLPEENTSNL